MCNGAYLGDGLSSPAGGDSSSSQFLEVDDGRKGLEGENPRVEQVTAAVQLSDQQPILCIPA